MLGFVFAVQFVPHLDTFGDRPAEDEPGLVQLGTAWWEYTTGDREGFAWSIHVDEHYHASVISQVQRFDRLVIGNPYTESPGEVSAIGSLYGGVHETGYHTLFAQIQDVTGIDTLHLYQFGPALWTALIAFGVYALVRPNPAAIPAAAFVALLPTSVRFLGTGFLVPIGFSLAWLPATAILTKPARNSAATALLLLAVIAWAFFVHLVAGFASIAIVLAVALFSGGQARKATLKLVLLGLIPVAWLWRSFSRGVQAQLEREATLPRDFTIFDNFGFITLMIWVVGVALYWLVPPEERDLRPTLAAFSTLSMVALGLIVASVAFDLNRYAMYSRMHPIFFLTATVPVGFAITTLASRTKRYLTRLLERISRIEKRTRWRAAIAGLVALSVGLTAAGPALSQGVGYHVREPYYRIMGEDAWQAFQTVEANLSEEDPYSVVLTDPWQAPLLFERTGLIPYTVGTPGAAPGNEQAWRAYLTGNDAPSDYVMNDITVVLGPREPAGDFWTQEAENVWLMERAYAEQIERIREGNSLQLDRLPDEPE